MVFHMYITCTFEICKETGRHFYYSGYQKIYDLPDVVPEAHREFVKMSDDALEYYVRLVTDENSTSVDNFLDKFPDWSSIVEDGSAFSESWDETTHDRFREALVWFSEQKICYMISWVY